MPAVSVQQAFALALQHHQAGRLGDAEALYRQILAVQPKHVDALHHLGIIAYQSSRHDLAVEWIGHAIVLNPNNFAAHYNLGEAYRSTGRFDEAIAAYGRALQFKADALEVHNSLGDVLRERGRLDEAAAAYRHALQLKPDWPEIWNNLGNVLFRLGQFAEAAIAYRRALQLQPDLPEAHNNLGGALAEQRQTEDAVAEFRRALLLRPDYPEAHNNLGNVLRERGQLEEAVAAYDRALRLRPDYPDAIYNLGNAFKDRGQFDEAVAAYRRALQLQPDLPEAHNNLGNALRDQGQLDAAMAAYRHVLQLKSDHLGAHSNLLYTLLFHPGGDHGTIAGEQNRWNRRFSDSLNRFVRPHGNDRNAGRRLRVGYLSPDFRDHVVGRNLLPLFRCHDRGQFEILCYSGVVKPDGMTEEFRPHADQWRSTVDVADEALSKMIRQDGVDILVDLTQHMAGNRLPVFARQPAPVQVSFAGYPESTGLEAITHRISDRYLELGDRKNDQVLLIDSFWCYDPHGVQVEVNALPAQENGRVTFGSLNSFCKVNEPVLKLWAQVLGKVKDSRLILLSRIGCHRQRTVEFLGREGVEPHRVEFAAPCPRKAYLELYHRLDIVLDPFPYNGHTTSLDALWMGVPVVSLAGEQAVSRAGLSQLSNLGLPDLVAYMEDDYVRIATQLGCNLPRLAELRQTLRERMLASPLMDAPRFARNIEAAYRAMWQRWCAEFPSPHRDKSTSL